MPNFGPSVIITLDVVTSVEKIARRMTLRAVDVMNKGFSSALPIIQSKVPMIIASSIIGSPTYQELVTRGPLWGELGVINPAPALDEMVQAVKNTAVIKLSRFRAVSTGGITGKLQVRFVNSSMKDYINKEGEYVSAPSGSKIKWLEWLLRGGDGIIVRNWDFVLRDPEHSRTGTGIMVEVGAGSEGWRVPPGHSGTADNNFITRAIDENFNTIIKTITKEILKGVTQ